MFVQLMWLLTMGPAAHADVAPPSANVIFDVPLIDAPFNAEAGDTTPSMAQSLGVTKAVYESMDYGIGLVVDPKTTGWKGFFARLAFIGADYVAFDLPLGEGWMHEEWHRAVMSSHGIASHNGVYDHHGTLIPVNHESDADLGRLKRDYPADQVRLAEAGMESEHELALAIEKDHYFRGTTTYDRMTLWYLHLSPLLYLDTCAGGTADRATDQQNAHDGTDVGERDFTGLDCTGWDYDLHRPTEPYAARGVHPSGVGINRYRKFSDLTPNEQRYLVLQRNLSFLNLLDPNLVGRSSFATPELPIERWNVVMRHHLTSFGYAIDANVFVSGSAGDALVILHTYVNKERTFPGLEVQLPAVTVAPGWLDAGARLAGWLQPQGQTFATAEAAAGGLVSARLSYTARPRFAPFIEAEAKSPGWVAGNVYLNEALAARIGFVATMF